MISLFALASLAAAAPLAAEPVATLQACPADRLHPYPLDDLRDAQLLIIPEIAIINRGSGDLSLHQVTIELLDGGIVKEARTLSTGDLAQAAKGGAALQASGLIEAAGFQFCDGNLLRDARLTAEPAFGPGEGVLIANQMFAYSGPRDAVRVMAGSTQLTLPIAKEPAPEVLFPLGPGAWTIANGPSPHTAHRWAITEQFGIDILRVDADGRSHRGEGRETRDYYAYGAPVLAVADGEVVRVSKAAVDSPLVIRQPGESDDAYLGRILVGQDERFAKGFAGLMGEAIVVRHGEQLYGVYAHLAPGSVTAKVGDRVGAADTIGKLGSSGNSTEPHLHFQMCDKPDGLSCTGRPVRYTNIRLPFADIARMVQSGDLVIVEAGEP